MGRRHGWRTQLARLYVWLQRLHQRCRRARHAVCGGSLVGGHGDVFSGGSLWTVVAVTGPLFDLLDLLVLSCSPVMLMLDLKWFPGVSLWFISLVLLDYLV